MSPMRVGKILRPVSMLIVLLLLWQAVDLVFHIPTFILPSPIEVLTKLIDKRDTLLINSAITLYEVLAGFALAVVIGIALAALIVHSRFLAESVYPLLVVSQVTPQVAVAPI